MPKKIRKLFGAAQGASKMDLDELLGRLPQGTPAQKLEAELMFKRLTEEQAARYAPTNPPTERGKEALRQAQNQLRERGKQKFLEPSKVKQRVYHGTTKDFSAFDKARLGESGAGGDRLGFWFSQEPEGTDLYTWGKENALTMPAYLRLQNPYLMPTEEFYELSKMPPLAGEKLRKDLIKQGHDGVIAETGEGDAYAVFEPTQIKSAIGNEGTYDIENPDITKAKGGLAHMAGGGKALRKALKGASRVDDAVPDIRTLVDANRPLTAAERAMVGRLAAEYTANQPVTRLSEALGNVGAEGKKLRVTQTDRTGAKYLGGAPFSMMQKVDPRYAESKATWGVKTRGAATNIINQSDPDVIWSTLIGSPTQHRSNELIFDKLYKAFQKSAKEGNLSPELRTKFNAALEPIFGEGADILDPKLRKEIDTFEKRAIVGNLLLGKDIGGATRGGSIIPGLKIMSETTEPMLKGVETFSIGPRLFTLDQGVITRPDLHPAFPEILTGQDLNQLFVPVPNRIALPTFNEDFRARTGRKKPGYYELTNTPEGDPYPTQFVDEDYLNFLQKEGYADGGVVHMQGGGDPGEVSGEMFSPKPLTIPAPLTDLADAIKRQFSKEKRTSQKPGTAQDVILGGYVAPIAGAPGDFLDEVGQILDHVQKTHPLMREKASVMDTGPERTPPMGYAPKVRFSAEGNAPYGSEQIRGGMERYGLISDERRPLLEIGTSLLAPFGAVKALKYGKALAPTAADIMETQLLRATEPMRMNIVPEGGPSGKVKAPANELGFYNPVEKAALNVQRKQGTGSAMVSDLKKTPGVNDERLTELGLGDLASRPNVTKDELIAAADQNRIPLRETVSRERDQAAINRLEEEYANLAQQFEILAGQGKPEEVTRISSALDKNLAEQNRLKSLPEARFGPTTSPYYSLPNGENYREIRVALPSNRPSIKNMSREEYNAAVAKADAEGVQDFTHTIHHGDEPNVLFHLRVADHVDADGKKGLLIDELQSDWHQQGRKKGYKSKVPQISWEDPEYVAARRRATELLNEFNRNSGNPAKQKEIRPLLDQATAEERRFTDLSNAYYRAVPDAPFKDNWYQLGLKRAIKEAADTGMDRVYLTTGARQADRYDLSKRVSHIDYRKSSVYDKYELGIVDINGDPIELPKERYSAEELQDIVGKEVADKIIKGEGQSGDNGKTLSGLDLKVGGEGMKQYYDKNYKNFLDKYAKQFGARIGETKIPSTDIMEHWPEFRDWFAQKYGDRGSALAAHSQWSQGRNNKNVREFEKQFPKEYEPVYYIDITPKMRESAKIGQSYKDGGAVRMAEGGAVDYEASFNQMLQDHVAGMAAGGAVDYESRFNDMLQKYVQGMAEGGAVNPYNEDPDMSDGGRFVQAPAFANGGAVKSIWTVN